MSSERSLDLPPVPDDYQPPRRVSAEEYHRLEEQLPGKYEYHNGLTYPKFYPPGSHWAMAGGTEAHDQITLRLLIALGSHLGDQGPCRVHTSDMKLRVSMQEEHYQEYYPDAYVACTDPMQPNRRELDDAVLVCEVRSQSTADFDRGDKFDAYKRLPSLAEYLILDNRRAQATLFRRSDDGSWRQFTFGEGTVLPLESVDQLLPVDRLYTGLTLDPDPTR
jgi:Uma2 family endonuclease